MTEDRRQQPVSAEWRSRLLELPRLNKRVILVALDFLLLSLALWISISLRYNTTYVPPDWFTGAACSRARRSSPSRRSRCRGSTGS